VEYASGVRCSSLLLVGGDGGCSVVGGSRRAIRGADMFEDDILTCEGVVRFGWRGTHRHRTNSNSERFGCYTRSHVMVANRAGVNAEYTTAHRSS
jgi:hypothetical protein